VNLSRSHHHSGCVIFAVSVQWVCYCLNRVQEGGLVEVVVFEHFLNVVVFIVVQGAPIKNNPLGDI